MKEKMANRKNLSISEAVLETARENQKKTALTCMNVKISYKKLLLKVEKLSTAFFCFGINKGDRALVALPNIPQCVYCIYALNRIGAVPALVSPIASTGELQTYIEKLKPKIIIAFETLRNNLEEIDYLVEDIPVVLTSPADELLPFSCVTKSGFLNWHQLLKIRVNRNVFVSPQRGGDTALILFSGGTTGKPKAVEISNYSLNTLAEGTASACEREVRGVKMLAALPMFHGFGFGICLHTVLYFGGNALLVPRFNPKSVGRLISKEKPQYIACVPAMLRSLQETSTLRKADLSRLSGVFSGGDILPSNLEESFNKFLTAHGSEVNVRQGYGLTECVAATCLMPEGVKKAGCIGKPYEAVSYKIVDAKTCTVYNELSRGSVGEICISGAMVMKGYFEDEEETSKALRVHEDGRIWLHTGDMGYMDSDGYVYFKGRLKRVIITNGNNVYPSEIERILLSHPAVSECCAVGVKDSVKMNVVAVYVVLEKSEVSDVEMKVQLSEYLGKFISKAAKPEYIHFTESLPKTPLGKIDFAELQRMAEASV